MHTQSEENYLKAIFSLQPDKNTVVSTNAIATKMKTKASSVTDMIKKLADKELVVYTKYQGAKLTKKGSSIALNIIRKHRIWETFLVNKLDFSWNEVHDVAEQLEHIKSESLIEKLDNYLGNPTKDPHGDLIPDKNGVFHQVERKLLSEIEENTPVTFVGLTDSSVAFLNYLDNKKLALGDELVITNIEKFDKSMVVRTKENEFLITKEVAKKIYVNNTY